MKILIVHNRYLIPGGEDMVFAAEVDLLRGRGHEVVTWEAHNAELAELSTPRAALETIWSWSGQRRMAAQLAAHRPDLVHFHNTFMRISPAAYYTCQAAGVPVVQTLHNYRLLCPEANFHRDGKICEECLGKFVPWPGVQHGCWRDSASQTAVVAAMLTTHRLLQTWQRQVTGFIALTEFARQKLIAGGLPGEKITVKPNFLSPPVAAALAATDHERGRTAHPGTPYALYVGRLSHEKGVLTLLRAWRNLPHVPLKLIGDGPLREAVMAEVAAHGLHQVEVLGAQPHAQVIQAMRGARVLVLPSDCYEGFPMTLVEAYAAALPVIGPQLGAMGELIQDGQTGLWFAPHHADSLAEKVAWAWQHPDVLQQMGQTARQVYAARYTADENYQCLMSIYAQAQAGHPRAAAAVSV